MSRLRPVPAHRLVAYLRRHGFVQASQVGSHLKMRRGNVTLVIPIHARHPIKAGLVLKILKQAGLDPHLALDEI